MATCAVRSAAGLPGGRTFRERHETYVETYRVGACTSRLGNQRPRPAPSMPCYSVRSELLAELAAMRDIDDDAALAGRKVNGLGVGDVVVLGD